MTSRTLNARTIQLHDVESNWLLVKDFIPRCGEIIIYDPDENYNYSRFKIGDGKTGVNKLSFVVDSILNEIFTPSGDTIYLDAGRINPDKTT